MAMTMRTRMERLGQWVKEACCSDLSMKTPAESGSDFDVDWVTPRCFVGNFYPMMTNQNPYSVAPSILVMFAGGNSAGEVMHYMDNRNNVKRPEEIAQTLEVQLIHAVYEPGTRTGKRTGERVDPHESIEWNDELDEGSMVLSDWMDRTCARLLGADSIPGTDLYVRRETVRWEPLKENGSVSDRRPIYLGVVEVTFETQTHEEINDAIRGLID